MNTVSVTRIDWVPSSIQCFNQLDEDDDDHDGDDDDVDDEGGDDDDHDGVNSDDEDAEDWWRAEFYSMFQSTRTQLLPYLTSVRRFKSENFSPYFMIILNNIQFLNIINQMKSNGK